MENKECKHVIFISWVLSLWVAKVFITSLFYKFSNAPETQHIFGTIGDWMGGFLGQGFGNIFSNYGGYVIGTFELIASLFLLSPAIFSLLKYVGIQKELPLRSVLQSTGGLMASVIMFGAIFFHLVSPLGVQVMFNGQTDGGSLFYSAVSIFVSGLILFFINGCCFGKKTFCSHGCGK
jgi:hypothetical protein